MKSSLFFAFYPPVALAFSLAAGFVLGWDTPFPYIPLPSVLIAVCALISEFRKSGRVAAPVAEKPQGSPLGLMVNQPFRGSPPTALPPEEVEQLIIGYRGFRFSSLSRDGGPALASLHIDDHGWEKTEVALCYNQTVGAPAPFTAKHLAAGTCTCGIYAYRTTKQLFANEPLTTLVWGEVRLEGVVLLYTGGFRAERATVERLWVAKSAILPEFDIVAHLSRRYECPVEVATWGGFTKDPLGNPYLAQGSAPSRVGTSSSPSRVGPSFLVNLVEAAARDEEVADEDEEEDNDEEGIEPCVHCGCLLCACPPSSVVQAVARLRQLSSRRGAPNEDA